MLDRQSASAAATGATLMAMLVGAPLGATMLLARVNGEFEDREAAVEFGTKLARGRAGASVDVADGRYGPIVRVSAIRSGQQTDEGPLPDSLVAEYWLDVRDGQGLATMVFSTPLADYAEAWLDYFDLCVDSLVRTGGEAESADAVPLPADENNTPFGEAAPLTAPQIEALSEEEGEA
jgi:hypothetical protein